LAPARPYWKGYLKLSLVSCPIALYPAISAAEKVSFRQVNRRTGNRLRHQLVDSVTGEEVDPFDKGRGYEVGENRFVMVEEEELEVARAAPPVTPNVADRLVAPASSAPALKAGARHLVEEEAEDEPEEVARPFKQKQENTRTIEIEHFVPRVQLDPAFFEKPYFVLPRDQVGQEAYAVIRDAQRWQLINPPKALVWEDDTGKVWLTYNSGEYVRGQIYPRHGLTMPPEAAKNLDQLFTDVSDLAVK
jgi:DNA end-binding protein Ku